MMSKTCPCKGCAPPKRNPGCHSKCDEYIKWKSELDKLNAKIRKENDLNQALSRHNFF